MACVLITHLRAKAELRRHAHLKDNSPIAVVDRTSGKPLVVDSSAGASARAGMTLEQAMSYHNGLIILDTDEPYYRRVFEDVIEALLQVGDRVEPAELGTAYARIDGLESLYGGEEKVAVALLDALPGWLNARVGVGRSKFTSYMAARLAPVQVSPSVPRTKQASSRPCLSSFCRCPMTLRTRCIASVSTAWVERPPFPVTCLPTASDAKGRWRGNCAPALMCACGSDQGGNVHRRACLSAVLIDFHRTSADGDGYPASNSVLQTATSAQARWLDHACRSHLWTPRPGRRTVRFKEPAGSWQSGPPN